MNGKAEALIFLINEAIQTQNLHTHYDLIRWVRKGWIKSNDEKIQEQIQETYWGTGTSEFLYSLNSTEVRNTLMAAGDKIREEIA